MTSPVLVGLQGPLMGKRFPIGKTPITFGRSEDNVVLLTSNFASRNHAELRCEDGGYVLRDRGSRNGTRVNGAPVTAHRLQPGDQIIIGDETFRFETGEPHPSASILADETILQMPAGPTLRVTISGGGPVGLSLALLLDHLLGSQVAIQVYEGRWKWEGDQILWKTPVEGNIRRMQVVTVQSRQYLKLPPEMQERLFTPGDFSEMWPSGPDSIEGHGPRNIRIATVEDKLLAMANEKKDRIQLVPAFFDATASRESLTGQHVLAICDGGRSRTRDHFAAKFGAPDPSIYSLNGVQVLDVVLGLRVKSELPDPMAVLLTVSQNRFLLNSLRGEGFLNMRLTDEEAKEAVGIDPIRQVFEECIQSRPCLMERNASGDFFCATHRTVFLPALLRGSALWRRVREGLRLFGVNEDNLTAVTAFRLDMVQRPRFTAQLFPATAKSPGTYGFLIGDAANAVHFWPGRGLNSGLAAAISLARCLKTAWRGATLRDADFARHEAMMSMLQYRHKSRAWRQMVTVDEEGNLQAIKDRIARGVAEGENGAFDRDEDLAALLERMRIIRHRLEKRLSGLPDDATLRKQLELLKGETIHTLLVSDAWDTANVGGEEVDVERFFAEALPPDADAPLPVHRFAGNKS
jgi:2-polyprenyl-6-methoxyphenol hydroxylase-like FAD-dependent oxidoreductase